MKQTGFFSKKIWYICLVGFCILCVMTIGMVNSQHWNSVSACISYGGVWKFIRSALTATLFSVIVIYVVRILDKMKEQQSYFLILTSILPATIIVTKILMLLGLGSVADGKEWWLSLFGYGNVSYVIIMAFFTFAFCGSWVNHLIEMKMKKEVLIVALYVTSFLVLSVILFRGLSGGLISSLYIILYYLWCSKKKNKYAVFIPFSAAFLYAVFYGVEKKASFTYFISVMKQVFGQSSEVIKQREMFVAECYEDLPVWYTYYNPFVSIKEYMSNIVVVFVILVYVFILVLLYLYVKKFIVTNIEDRKYAISLIVAMAIGTAISVVKHLGLTGMDVGIDLPFLIQSGFIWLEVVLIVFALPSKDKK